MYRAADDSDYLVSEEEDKNRVNERARMLRAKGMSEADAMRKSLGVAGNTMTSMFGGTAAPSEMSGEVVQNLVQGAGDAQKRLAMMNGAPMPKEPPQVSDVPQLPGTVEEPPATTMPVKPRPIVNADPGMPPGSDRKVLDPTEGTVTPLPRVIDDSAQRLQLQEILRQLALRQPLPQGMSQRMIA